MSETPGSPSELRLLVGEAFALSGLSPDQQESFETAKQSAEYPQALQNYADALWRWVELNTPASTYEVLAKAKFDLADTAQNHRDIEIGKLRFLLQRAVYVDGIKHGEGWKPSHARFLAGFDHTARQLGDDDLFQVATHRHYRRRKGDPSLLKFQLLNCWLSAGLWRMESREQQWAALEKMGWPRGEFSEHSLNMAQTRLGLKWFKPRSHKSTRRL